MKKSNLAAIMKTTLCISFLLCIGAYILYRRSGQGWLFSCAITFGTIAYHFLIRFASPVILNAIFRNKYDPNSRWFRQKSWEQKLYKRLKVKNWKAHVPAYDPSQFSLSEHTAEEIIINMCRAEAVHELIILLGFTTLLFAIPFGEFPVFLITAIAAGCIDSVFVILQRFNRPRMERLLNKQMNRIS